MMILQTLLVVICLVLLVDTVGRILYRDVKDFEELPFTIGSNIVSMVVMVILLFIIGGM